MDEGYIKFQAEQVAGSIVQPAEFDQLNRARTELFDFGLIGSYDNGIGFGNLSLREQGQHFLITASATGGERVLRFAQYCLVESFSRAQSCARARRAAGLLGVHDPRCHLCSQPGSSMRDAYP